MNIVRKTFSKIRIDKIERSIINAVKNEEFDAAWDMLQPLLKAQTTNEDAVLSVLKLVNKQCFTIERSVEALSHIFEAHCDNVLILSKLGSALENARDIDQLNLEPPGDPLFENVIAALSVALTENTNTPNEQMILDGLSTAARMVARQHDDITGNSYKRLIELNPNDSLNHYCYGLFCKTRGLFDDGVRANQKAASLVDEPIDSHQWNLGICATGAGKGEIALDVWKRMGNKIEMGRFGLPEGGYPSCKVRLAQYPLAERSSDNDFPGLEETIWIERLSPCHGIIRSVLFQDLGVDYGDVILMDGAPITYHSYGDQEIAVFPHLATLLRNEYQFFDFAGVQQEQSQIYNISESLERDAVIYSHTENFRVLCSTCWRDPSINHENHKSEEKNIVTGRIAAPKDMKACDLLAQIDNAINELLECSVYAPKLCEKAGLAERAEIEQRRFNMLTDN